MTTTTAKPLPRRQQIYRDKVAPALREEFGYANVMMIPRLTKIAGFEWGTGFYINPTPPEVAAGCLREVDH